MDGVTLQDLYSRALGAAARSVGMPYDLYRPRGVDHPLRSELRVLRLPAAFDLGNPGYRRPRGYERAFRGTFDGVCTQVGDYLRGPRGDLFIAMLPPFQMPLCVATNAVVDVLRPGGPEVPGLSGYGGVREPRLRTVLAGWPAQILGGVAGAAAGGVVGGKALPDDGGMSGWTVLLPLLPAPILGSDLLRDGEGRRFLVRTAELSELGWRLVVRQLGV